MGTLIESWASLKSFKKKGDDRGVRRRSWSVGWLRVLRSRLAVQFLDLRHGDQEGLRLVWTVKETRLHDAVDVPSHLRPLRQRSCRSERARPSELPSCR